MRCSVFFCILIVAASADFGSAHASSRCVDLLESQADATTGLIAYLRSLYRDHRQIPEPAFQRFVGRLRLGFLENPFPENGGNSAALLHREEIQKYIDSGEVDRTRLLEWASGLKEEEGENLIRRAESRADTLYRKMEFCPVHPVRKKRTAAKDSDELMPTQPEVRTPFELMTTDVTQWMWVQEMGQNPSFFQDGPYSVTVDVGGRSVRLQPDNPVENVTWWSSLVFANRVSKRAGLRAVYDFGRIRWKKETSAEAGTLEPQDEASASKILKLKRGADGYRLPLDAEWDLMLSQIKGDGFVFVPSSRLGLPLLFLDYGWFSENIDTEGTQLVASAPKSFLIGERKIHDVFGNVSKWMFDVSGTMRKERGTRGNSFASNVVWAANKGGAGCLRMSSTKGSV